MRWSEEDVVAWLDRAGLLLGRKVLEVRSRSHRATSVLVTLEDGTSLFVKRPSNERREGAILALLTGRDDLSGVRDLLPELIRYDGTLNVAVTAGLTEHTVMREMCRWRPPGRGPLVRAVGAALARLHAISSASGLTAEDVCPRVTNPVPTFGEFSPGDLARAPGRDFPRFLAIVQEVDEALRQMRDGWRPACFIHGDFKDDNIMIGGTADRPMLTFIDWEMSGWGDPLWDVGSMVGQFLYHWVTSIKPGAGDFASWVRNASVPFSEVRTSTAEFIATYAAASGRPLLGQDDCLTKIVRFAGLFLLHRAITTLELMGVLPGPAANCLQVGRTLLGDPSRLTDILLVEAAA